MQVDSSGERELLFNARFRACPKGVEETFISVQALQSGLQTLMAIIKPRNFTGT